MEDRIAVLRASKTEEKAAFAGEAQQANRRYLYFAQKATSAGGRASAVQFLKFRFANAQIVRLKTPGTRVAAGIDHPDYAHLTVLPETMRAALSEDFDRAVGG